MRFGREGFAVVARSATAMAMATKSRADEIPTIVARFEVRRRDKNQAAHILEEFLSASVLALQ